VKRRITDKQGRRFNDDMIVVTGNAAASIAPRNAVFKVVPFVLVKPVYLAARKASLGKGGTLEQKRQNAMEWLAKLGVTEDQVFATLDVKGMEDVGEEQLITIRGIRTAIQDGETTATQAFKRPEEGSEAVDDLNSRVKAAAKGKTPDKAVAPHTATAVTEKGEIVGYKCSCTKYLSGEDPAGALEAHLAEAELRGDVVTRG